MNQPWPIIGDHVESKGYLKGGPDVRFLNGTMPAVLDAVALCLQESHAPPPLYIVSCIVGIAHIARWLEPDTARPEFVVTIEHAAEQALMRYPPDDWTSSEVVDCISSRCPAVREATLVLVQYRTSPSVSNHS